MFCAFFSPFCSLLPSDRPFQLYQRLFQSGPGAGQDNPLKQLRLGAENVPGVQPQPGPVNDAVVEGPAVHPQPGAVQPGKVSPLRLHQLDLRQPLGQEGPEKGQVFPQIGLALLQPRTALPVGRLAGHKAQGVQRSIAAASQLRLEPGPGRLTGDPDVGHL